MMKLLLVSSNIRFDNPADGPNSWIHRKALLSQTLLAHGPDLIATQEGRFEQLKDFLSLLPGYDLVDQHRSWIGERMYPTFFIKNSSFELLKSEDLWLSETPGIAGSLSFGSTFPRLMTWMKVQPCGSKKNLIVVNTHLDHVRAETRKEQALVLVREIRRILEPQNRLIIMGDFNESPKGEVRNILLGEFPELIDTWRLFHNMEETSHHAFNGEVQNGSRIDWILVDGSLEIKSAFLDKTHERGKYPSDHFPMVCELSI